MLLALSEHKPLVCGASTYQTIRRMMHARTPHTHANLRRLDCCCSLQRGTALRTTSSRAELSRGVGVSGHTLATQPIHACVLAVSLSLCLSTHNCAHVATVMPVELLSRNSQPPPQSYHVRRRGRLGHCCEFLALLALDSSPQQRHALQSCHVNHMPSQNEGLI
jgi:hypothetical protein